MNNIGVRLIVCCFLAVFSVGLSHAKNRALLIGISEYSPKYQWNSISGANDIDLIKGVLKDFSCAFSPNTSNINAFSGVV